MKAGKAQRRKHEQKLGLPRARFARTAATVMRLYHQEQNLALITLKHWRTLTHGLTLVTCMDFH